MSETSAPLPADIRPRRLHLDWLLPLLIRPRSAFRTMTAAAGDAWLTPLLILSLAELVRVWAVGSVRQALAATGQVTLPPDFQYWSPTMQAQFTQAQQATSSPVFVYVFPGLVALAGVWLGWLLTAALLHLVLTMLGGRSATREALNVVAWAMLPFALRALVRAGYAFSTQALIVSPGLAGFVPADAAGALIFLREALAFVDAYWLWHVALLMVGGRQASGLAVGKVVAGALVAALGVLLLQALPGFGMAQLDGLQVVRPFF